LAVNTEHKGMVRKSGIRVEVLKAYLVT